MFASKRDTHKKDESNGQTWSDIMDGKQWHFPWMDPLKIGLLAFYLIRSPFANGHPNDIKRNLKLNAKVFRCHQKRTNKKLPWFYFSCTLSDCRAEAMTRMQFNEKFSPIKRIADTEFRHFAAQIATWNGPSFLTQFVVGSRRSSVSKSHQ